MGFYTCKHFDIWELVDRETFERWGERAWMFFRQDALISLDNIREYFSSPVIVNSWHDGGDLSQSGLRMLNKDTEKIYSPYSQHALGGAFDAKVQGIKADDVRKEILEHKDDQAFVLITCLEINIPWVHFDCRNIPDRIRLVKP